MKYLFVGGPHHGQNLVVKGRPALYMSDDADDAEHEGRYVCRKVWMPIDGTRYARRVYAWEFDQPMGMVVDAIARDWFMQDDALGEDKT